MDKKEDNKYEELPPQFHAHSASDGPSSGMDDGPELAQFIAQLRMHNLVDNQNSKGLVVYADD